jgi:hypothetical protein
VRDREFDSVVQLAQDSLIWRVGSWFVEGWRAAWASSTIVRTTRNAQSSIAKWPIETRVRCAALTIGWAGIGYAVSSYFLPRYVVSALPIAWAGMIVLGALVVAALPGAFAIAWEEKVRRAQTGEKES